MVHLFEKLKFERYPKTFDKALKPWNAADVLLLENYNRIALTNSKIAIYNDRFGFLAVNLESKSVTNIVSYKSQYNKP